MPQINSAARFLALALAACALFELAAIHCDSRAFGADEHSAGQPLTTEERASLQAELQALQKQMAGLRDSPGVSSDHWADTAVFVKGVEWALDFGPVNDERSRGLVKFALKRAVEREKMLAAERADWAHRRGRVLRGFVSNVDGSVQPYGVSIPESYNPATPMRLHVVLHGSTPATGIGELLFLEAADGGDQGTAVAPSNPYIELYPMGRLGENAYRFEGETDVDEAIDAVCRNYNIDRTRIVLRGHSLGGVGTWQLGLKKPDHWVAIGPAAGPVDTHVFSESPWKHFVRLEPLAAWQETTLHLIDAIDYTANAGMVPVVAAMGDQDPYYSSHLLIEQAFAKEGVALNGLVDHGAGHSISLAVAQHQIDLLDELAARGSDPFPKHVRFTTWTLKYSRCHWIKMLGLEQHYQRAEIDARIETDGSVNVAEPQNVTRFSIAPPAISSRTEFVTIAGNRVAISKSVVELAQPFVFEKRGGSWICSGPLTTKELSGKRPTLQGPMDDAFASKFLCVRGTGQAWSRQVGEWANANLRRFADEWRRHYRGYLPVKDDSDITEDDIRSSNLILFGDPGSNSLIAKVLPQLPVEWTRDTLQFGAHRYAPTDHAVEMIYPNPLPAAKERYVVLNSGHTYHDAELRFSYMVFPRLGDWAVIRVGENPPSEPVGSVVESVVNSGFFDEMWAVQDH